MEPQRTRSSALAFDDNLAPAGPPVLLVHGHPFNRTMWQPQFQWLTDLGHRAIAADLRGYGESRLPAATRGDSAQPAFTLLEDFAQDLVGLLDACRVDRTVLVGLSMGGQIVMELCRQIPSRVAGVVLAATFPQAETAEGISRREQMANRLLAEGMESYATEVLPSMVGASTLEARPEIGQRVLAMMRGTDPAAAAAALRGRARRPDYAGTLASLRAPAAIVVGDTDAFTSRRDAERMHSLVEGSVLHWLPGVGHMPNLEATDRFNAALAGVLESAAVSARP